jgi:type II secretory ATPase GspE/PulE/Tfp pilus assembly ATPase PilB-like protein
VADGMLTLRQSGLRKVCEGVTTVDEVARETVH